MDQEWNKRFKPFESKNEKHKVSNLHLHNMLNLSMFGTVNIGQQIDSGYAAFIHRHNEQVDKNHQILSRIISCIKFYEKFELPLRGHDETTQSKNPGVFLGLIDFACNLDPSLRKHMDSNAAFKRTSKTIQNEILDSIMFVCQDHIKNEISKSDFLAIMTDETTDMQDKSQMVIVLRYEIKWESC